ncbi:MAG: U32 family peptidase [Alphaproteobacteria bacterium]|nr:U32 family peptidase [Alphaproteobacteria bacterium]
MKRSAATTRPGTRARRRQTLETAAAGLTLGPLLHNWPAEKRRDFYFRIADESPFDAVCLGEVVCSKRAHQFDPHLGEVAERLRRAGKTAVHSSLALVTGARDMEFVRSAAAREGTIEANDLAAVELLRGRPHHVGPYVNVYGEDTVKLLSRLGATRICLPIELSAEAVAAIAKASPAEIEVVVFGRIPLAMSVRCFHARSRGRRKDTCRFVCGEDADGLPIGTVEGEKFLAIAGCQVLSHAYLNLAGEVARLRRAGARRFRVLPQAADMVAIGSTFRRLLDGAIDAKEAQARLRTLTPRAVGFINGFVHGQPGEAWIQVRAA